MVPVGTKIKGKMATRSITKRRAENADETPARGRILDAAFSAFMESGYAGTSTLEIATRARVSKRELYALVGSKEKMLAACISERAKRLQLPADVPQPHDRETLSPVRVTFGTHMFRDIPHPTALALFRLPLPQPA